MRVDEIAPGLWRWTGLHPSWTPAEGGPDGWEQEVGSVYYEAPGADDREGVRVKLRPVLELPVERVLVAHGQPVLTDGRAALAQALEEV